MRNKGLGNLPEASDWTLIEQVTHITTDFSRLRISNDYTTMMCIL